MCFLRAGYRVVLVETKQARAMPPTTLTALRILLTPPHSFTPHASPLTPHSLLLATGHRPPTAHCSPPTEQAALDRGVKLVQADIAKQLKRGKLSEAAARSQAARLSPTLAFADLARCATLVQAVTLPLPQAPTPNPYPSSLPLARCEMVVEAVFESLAVKRQIFAQLEAICPASTLLCTNTSALDIDQIAAAAPTRPHMVMGMHFFSPANVMRLVENVRAARTAPAVVAAVTLVALRLGKTPVLVGNCPGFVGNRMLAPYGVEAEALVTVEGVPPRAVDDALSLGLGMAMGPLAVGDLAGLEIGQAPRKAQGLYDPDRHFVDLLNSKGRIGQKSGSGWYRYDAAVGGGRQPLLDPEVGALLQAHRARNGLSAPYAPRAEGGGGVAPPPADELVERCLLPLVNEGLRCLHEGIARTPADVDIVWILGYGFPAWRGGPMHWAEEQLGLPYVLRRMREIGASRPELGAAFARRWEPSPLLLAAVEGRTSLAETLARVRRAAGTRAAPSKL